MHKKNYQKVECLFQFSMRSNSSGKSVKVYFPHMQLIMAVIETKHVLKFNCKSITSITGIYLTILFSF